MPEEVKDRRYELIPEYEIPAATPKNKVWLTQDGAVRVNPPKEGPKTDVEKMWDEYKSNRAG